MDTEEISEKLASNPADRKLVERLYNHGKITKEARDYALTLLNPRDQWGDWVFRMLLTLGTALLLAGIVYFFAFNWAKIPPIAKLSSIQLGIVGCSVGAYFYSLNHLGGRLLLLSGSVLIGVFMAVFGQIYQTGADAYQLFMTWSLLTLGWTLLSNFAAQWILWLAITDIALGLWTIQFATLTAQSSYVIIARITLYTAVLIAREYFATQQGYEWLIPRWTRFILVLAAIQAAHIPVFFSIIAFEQATTLSVLTAIVGIIVHCAAYIAYGHKLRDMWCLAITLLSGSLLFLTLVFKLTFNGDVVAPLIIMAVVTLVVFTTSIMHILYLSTKVGGRHA